MTNVACAFVDLLIFMFKMADVYIFHGQNFLDPVYIDRYIFCLNRRNLLWTYALTNQ